MYADGGTDAMENMFYSIEFRIKRKLARMLNHIVHGGTIYLQNGSINIVHFYISINIIISLILTVYVYVLKFSPEIEITDVQYADSTICVHSRNIKGDGEYSFWILNERGSIK
jgi:hypothetical protein